jgi:hypothetical protein
MSRSSRLDQRHRHELERFVEARIDLRKQHRELVALGERRIEHRRQEPARGAFATPLRRRENGANAEHPPDASGDASAQVVTLRARRHQPLLDERDAIEMPGAPGRRQLGPPVALVLRRRQPLAPQGM